MERANDAAMDRQQKIIPIVAERLVLGKEEQITGTVLIDKKVIDEDFSQTLTLQQQEVQVERRTVGRFVDDALPTVRTEGNSIIIPVLKEVMVKRTWWEEEVVITTISKEETVAVEEVLRREKVSIQRTAANE